ncbi:MAG TPA: cytochrome c biogenesis protein CcsA [Burkholderiales bacterium]|nr:cytochrome c biogenesis protein CcsA [Burkholderiales bacterium]
MPDIVVHLVASAAYLGLAWHFLNTRWRRHASAAGTAAQPGLAAWERAALLAPLALHGWTIYQSLFASSELRLGFALALSATLWLGVALYWLESLFVHLDGLEPMVLAGAAVACALPPVFPGLVSPQGFGNAAFTLHVLLFVLAYGVLTIAILHVALMAYLERDLHYSRQPGAAPLLRLPTLPPLLTMERLLFRLILVSFLLMTAALVLGVAVSETTFGRPFRFDHKNVFSLLAWLTLAILLVGRFFYGWRGRTALKWTMAAFLFLMLAYVGRSFVLEVLLGRS